MTRAMKSYVVQETAISGMINMVLSIGFVFVTFHGMASVPPHGPRGLLRDAFPQTIAIALMGSLVPAWITLRRGTKAAVPLPTTTRRIRPGNVALRSLLIAAVASLIGVSFWALMLADRTAALTFGQVVVIKACFGAAEACFVTPVALILAIHDSAGRQGDVRASRQARS